MIDTFNNTKGFAKTVQFYTFYEMVKCTFWLKRRIGEMEGRGGGRKGERGYGGGGRAKEKGKRRDGRGGGRLLERKGDL